MTEEMQQLKVEAETAKQSFAFGQISYEEVSKRVLPYIQAVNKRGKEIAKEHKMPFQPLTIFKFLR